MADIQLIKTILRESWTWADVHSRLAAHGVRFIRKGRGVVIVDSEGHSFTLKTLGPSVALYHLERRLGPLAYDPRNLTLKSLEKDSVRLINLRKKILEVVSDENLDTQDKIYRLGRLNREFPNFQIDHFAGQYTARLAKGQKVDPCAPVFEMWLRHMSPLTNPCTLPEKAVHAGAEASKILNNLFSEDGFHFIMIHTGLKNIMGMTGMGLNPNLVVRDFCGNLIAVFKVRKENRLTKEIVHGILTAFDGVQLQYIEQNRTDFEILFESGDECSLFGMYSQWMQAQGGVDEKAEANSQEMPEHPSSPEIRKVPEGQDDQERKRLLLYKAQMDDVFRILKQKGKPIDMSEVDAKIAVRLRGIRHSENEIAAILVAAGMFLRSDKHDWKDYSRRTVKYAFGKDGDAQLVKYARWLPEWEKLEKAALVDL